MLGEPIDRDMRSSPDPAGFSLEDCEAYAQEEDRAPTDEATGARAAGWRRSKATSC
jgi:hypothetical protein